MPKEDPQERWQAFKQEVKVLIVDDEESLRGILTETIGDAGLKTGTAGTGEEALEKFKNENWHVVLTDIRMPGMNGIELLQQIKEKYPQTEVVIMTSHASMDTALEAIRAGAYDYLMKPFDNLEDVVALLHRVIEKTFLKLENERLIRDLTEANFKLKEKNRETQTLYNFSKFLTQTLEMTEVMKLSLSCFSQLGRGMPTVFLAYIQGKLVVTDTYPEESLADKKLKALISLESMRLEEMMSWFHNINNEEVFKQTIKLHFKTDSFFAAPLFVSNKPFGILVSLAEDAQSFPIKIGRLLNQFSQMVAVAVDNAFLHKQMKETAIKDGLTGLFNHRYFQERLSSEVSRAERHGHPVSLIFIDVDHFKIFNDTNGHPRGDMVLKGVSAILSKQSRKSDIVARYGGEEFVVILPETPKGGAVKFAEQIRHAIESHSFPGEETQPLGKVTASFGVAEYPGDASEVKTVISSADLALYHGKETGRNSVTPFDPKFVSDSNAEEEKPVGEETRPQA